METVFIITWTLVSFYVTSPEPSIDAYGRVSPCITAVGIVKTVTSEHSKTFEKFSDVEEWVKNCPFKTENSSLNPFNNYVINVRINGIKIESMEDLIASFPKEISK